MPQTSLSISCCPIGRSGTQTDKSIPNEKARHNANTDPKKTEIQENPKLNRKLNLPDPKEIPPLIPPPRPPATSNIEHSLLNVLVKPQIEFAVRVQSLRVVGRIDVASIAAGAIRGEICIVRWGSEPNTCRRAAEKVAESVGLEGSR